MDDIDHVSETDSEELRKLSASVDSLSGDCSTMVYTWCTHVQIEVLVYLIVLAHFLAMGGHSPLQVMFTAA